MSDVPKNDSSSDSYEELFLRVADRVERWLVRALLLLAALFVISQGLLQIPAVRSVLSAVESLEGVPYDPN